MTKENVIEWSMLNETIYLYIPIIYADNLFRITCSQTYISLEEAQKALSEIIVWREWREEELGIVSTYKRIMKIPLDEL